MEINGLNNKIKEIVGNCSKDDIKVLNFIFERLLSEEDILRRLDEGDCKVLYEIKRKIKNEIGELIQTSPLSLSLFSSKNEMGNMLFFLFMVCFQNGEKDGVTITTEGKEFSDLDQGEKNVLFYLRLLLMRTLLSKVKLIDSPHSISNFFKLFESDMGDVIKGPTINEDIFYGVCSAFGYGVVKNRKSDVPLVVLENKETIVKVVEVIDGNKTAGIHFNEDDFDQILHYVNDYEKIKREKRIKLEPSDVIIGQGSFGIVKKGKFTILRKNKSLATNIRYNFDNEDDFFTEDVAIKTLQTDLLTRGMSSPLYDGRVEWVNTEIYTWLQLHQNQYVHPEDFDKYAKMTLQERKMFGVNRDRLPGNVNHGVMPIYFIYVSGGEGNMADKVCINFVSPLMAGDLIDFFHGITEGNFKKTEHRIKDGDVVEYSIISKNVLPDILIGMVSGMDSMHNNTEYTGGQYKSFLHSDLNPRNYLWCLRRPLKLDNDNIEVDSTDFIVLITDFGYSNKLVQSKYQDQYKIIGETVNLKNFYSPLFRPGTMIKIRASNFGKEIDATLVNYEMRTAPENGTEEKRILYGFSEVADFQALTLSYLFLLSGYCTGYTLSTYDRDKWFKQTDSGHYSISDLMRLLLLDVEIKNKTEIPNSNKCSFVSRHMLKLKDEYKKDKSAFMATIDSDYDKFLMPFFMPYSIRDTIHNKKQ